MPGSARLQHAVIVCVVTTSLFAASDCTADRSGGNGDGQASSAASQPAKDPSEKQGAPAEIVWAAKLDVIGQPVEAGPAVLALVATNDGGVELVSLDRESGRVNFRMPYHPGGAATGVPMTPRATQTDAGRHVAVLRRHDPGAAGPALVAVDVTSGDILSSTPYAMDDYEACSDGHDVCWSGFPDRPGQIVDGPFGPFRDIVQGGAPRRWDLETGRIAEKTLKVGATRVGDPDLFALGEGRLATLVRLPGTRRTKWTQSVSVLVGDGVSAKYGWSFEHDADADVYVGALGKPLPPKLVRRYAQGKKVAMTYADRNVVAGIDGRTGQHLWDREGADAWCPLVRSLPETGPRTLCVVSGTRIDVKGAKPTTKDLSVEMQGVDPRSGEVTWTFGLAGEDAEWAYLDRRAPLAPYGVVLPSEDGPVALDERTGELERVGDDTVVLCSAGPATVAAYGKRYAAGRLYRACDPSGKAVTGELSLFGASALAGTGPLRFVAMPGRVVAYRVE
jgi:hypothetical protein